MSRFRYTPTVEQVAELVRPRLDAIAQHPEYDGGPLTDIADLIVRLADRDRLLEDFLAHFQVGHGTPQNRVSVPGRGVYIDLDGGANTTLYVNETGGIAGWVAK